MAIAPGTTVPPVAATRQDGERVTVSLASPTVLAFLPAPDPEGEVRELLGFDDALADFRAAGVAVYGLSPADPERHAAVADAHDCSLPLLADPEGNVAEAYGVDPGERVTYVCARRQACGVYEGVHPTRHARAVLTDLVEFGLADPPG
jgi:peroxiredoxin Q/BCP